MVLELLGRLFSTSRKKCLASPTRSSRARLSQCTWATGVFQAILARMGQPDSDTAQGTLTLLVGSGFDFFPNLLSKEGSGG